MPPEPDTLISIEDLRVHFRTGEGVARAVDGVTFAIRSGETLALVGESGSGKSVTALSILRLVQQPAGFIAGGAIRFDGRDLTALSDADMRAVRGNRIAMVFQEPMTALNPVFTVGHQIDEVFRLHQGLSAKEARRRSITMLEKVNIPDPARRHGEYPFQLSGGMRQRVMIAMALACKPELLIADEPTTALDVTVQAQVFSLMRGLVREEGAAVLLITHDMGVVAENADRVAVMYGGRIVEEAPRAELFANPAHPYTRLLLRSLPGRGARTHRLAAIEGMVPKATEFPPGCRFANRCPQAMDRCRTTQPADYPANTHAGCQGGASSSPLNPPEGATGTFSLSSPGVAECADGIGDEVRAACDASADSATLRLKSEPVAVPLSRGVRGDARTASPRTAAGGAAHRAACFLLEPGAAKAGMALAGGLRPAPPSVLDTGVPRLDVRDLKIHFPIRKGLFKKTVGHVRAVDGVSFTIHKGETLALVGESGCGKTTIGRGIVRLVRPTDGSIAFHGEELLGLSRAALRKFRRRIQFVFQDPQSSLNPRMTAGDAIREGMDVHGVGGTDAERTARVHALLERVGLRPAMALRYPHEFSGGQRQRIGVARALAVEPELIICDEATSSLDVSVQAQVLNLLRDLQAEMGLSYLFITHNMSVVEYLADRVAVMYLGRIVEEGRTDELFGGGARHPYTRALLSAVPRIEPDGRERLVLEGDVPSPSAPPAGCHFHPRCPHALPRCREAYPARAAFSPTHSCRCWLHA